MDSETIIRQIEREEQVIIKVITREFCEKLTGEVFTDDVWERMRANPKLTTHTLVDIQDVIDAYNEANVYRCPECGATELNVLFDIEGTVTVDSDGEYGPKTRGVYDLTNYLSYSRLQCVDGHRIRDDGDYREIIELAESKMRDELHSIETGL